MCNCTSRIHSFMCFMRNLATDTNDSARDCGSAKNARQDETRGTLAACRPVMRVLTSPDSQGRRRELPSVAEAGR